MSEAIDDAILAILGGDQIDTGQFGPLGVAIFDGEQQPFLAHPDHPDKFVVTYKLPYAVYTSNVGLPSNRRLTGRNTRNSTFFAIQYVGGDRRQAKWAGQQIRDAIDGLRLPLDELRMGLVALEASPRIWRSDDAIRPDKAPVYYGVDEYAVGASLRRPFPVGGS